MVILVGNKVDDIDNRKIKKEFGEYYCKKKALFKYVEASAKEGLNVA